MRRIAIVRLTFLIVQTNIKQRDALAQLPLKDTSVVEIIIIILAIVK